MNRTWDEARDVPRVRQAFVTLVQSADRWPTPRQFFDALPRIEMPLSLESQAKPASKEEAAAAMARIRAMLDEGQAKPVQQAKPETTPEERQAAEDELRRHYGRDGKAAAAGEDK